MNPHLKLIFFDNSPAIVKAYEDALSSYPFVMVTSQDFRTLKCDAIVSPANSFGYMDGGIDLAYSEHFGWDLSERLREMIKSESVRGELLVGNYIALPTHNENIPMLISAPTMRVPSIVQETTNAYLAMRAVIQCARRMMFMTVAIPGLCTGCGKMSPERCASQVKEAIEEFWTPKERVSLREHSRQHYRMLGVPLGNLGENNH